MAIYYFTIEAIPFSNNPEIKECAGAYVSCWVDATDVDTARLQANAFINEEGWEVLSVKDQFMVFREQFEDDLDHEEALECFDQAESEGIAAIFHVWPYDD